MSFARGITNLPTEILPSPNTLEGPFYALSHRQGARAANLRPGSTKARLPASTPFSSPPPVVSCGSTTSSCMAHELRLGFTFLSGGKL